MENWQRHEVLKKDVSNLTRPADETLEARIQGGKELETESQESRKCSQNTLY